MTSLRVLQELMLLNVRKSDIKNRLRSVVANVTNSVHTPSSKENSNRFELILISLVPGPLN